MRQYIIILWSFLLVVFSACEDALDITPENSLTFKNTLETEGDMEAAVRNIAQHFRDFSSTEAYGNEAMGCFADNVLGYYESGIRNLDPQYIRKSSWITWYQIIGYTDVVLTHVDQIESAQERKDYYRGQAYFYKALVYFNIVRKWGDCIIMGNVDDLTPKAS